MRLSARARRRLIAEIESRLSKPKITDWEYTRYLIHLRNEYNCQRLRELRRKYPGGVKGELMARPLREALKHLMGNDDMLTEPFEYRERARKVENYWHSALVLARKGSAKEFVGGVKAAFDRRYPPEYAGLTVDDEGHVTTKREWREVMEQQDPMEVD